MFSNILKFGWRNLMRNRRRTFLTVLAITVGVLSLIFAGSYIRGILNNVVETSIKTQTGHIRIAHEEYFRMERILPKEYLVTGLQQFQHTVSGFPGVESIEKRLKFNVLLSHGDVNKAGLAVGIEPKVTDRNMNLSKAIVKGGYFGGNGERADLIIGKKLAEKLGVTVNDELLLVTTDINYSTYALPFNVSGIFQTGYNYMDKHAIYISLAKAQEMLDCGDAAHEVLVFLNNPDQSRVIAGEIKKSLSESNQGQGIRVIPWQEDDMIKNMPTIAAIWDKILWIIMFIVALVILNTMLMSVMERYHEIGVLKALGFKNREVFFMIMAEAFYLGIIGSVIGGILGGTISAIFEKVGFQMAKLAGGLMDKIDIPMPFIGTVLYPDLTFSVLAGSIAFGVVVALAAVLYPAVKSVRMQPVEAFRSELKV
jgi:putative ABC transport system permease protein